MKVRIDPRKLNDVTAYLAGMGQRLTDLSVPLWAGARRAKEDTLRDFATGGAFGGEPWLPPSAATLKRDKYHDAHNPVRPTGAHRPLILSGRFQASVRAYAGKFEGGVTLGPAYFLNTAGTTGPSGAEKNPPREAGYISNETIEWTMNAILRYAIEENQ